MSKYFGVATRIGTVHIFTFVDLKNYIADIVYKKYYNKERNPDILLYISNYSENSIEPFYI